MSRQASDMSEQDVRSYIRHHQAELANSFRYFFQHLRFLRWGYYILLKKYLLRFLGMNRDQLPVEQNACEPPIVGEVVSDETVNPNVELTGSEPASSAERPC